MKSLKLNTFLLFFGLIIFNKPSLGCERISLELENQIIEQKEQESKVEHENEILKNLVLLKKLNTKQPESSKEVYENYFKLYINNKPFGHINWHMNF